MLLEPEVVASPLQHESGIIYSVDNLLRREIDLAPDRGLSARLNTSAPGDFKRLQKLLGIGGIQCRFLVAIALL